MKIEFKKVIGQTEFTFHAEAEGIKDFFEQVSVFEDIPVTGPNGENDLKISFRTTKQGHKYYSVVCESAKQEFKFGQATDNVSMFPKGWEPLYQGDANGQQQSNVGGLGQAQENYASANGLGAQNNNITPQANVAPQAQPQNVAQVPQAPVATPAAPAPQNAAVSDVLSKYGIGQ